MAQKVQVLDPGSYSVKRLMARSPIVGFSVASAEHRVLSSALESKSRRGDIVRELQEMLPGKRLTGDAVTLALPTDRVLHRELEMPFADRAQLDNVLQFELENHVPFAADEMGFDCLVQHKDKSGARLYVSAVHERELSETREMLETLQLDPRVITDSGVALGRLHELLLEQPEGSVAFLDIGHRKSTMTVVEDGKFKGTRTSMVGGYDLTYALSDHFDIGMEEAEGLKHKAHLYPAGEGQAVGQIQEVADILKRALAPLLRDLHQSMRQLKGIDHLFVFGGTARLQGVTQYLEEKLHIPSTRLFPSMLKGGLDAEEEGLPYVSAIATGFASLRGGDALRINFRKGAFAYEGDFKAIQGRLIYLAVMAIWLVILLGAPQVMQYGSLVEQKETLQSELLNISEEILGEELEDYAEVLGELEQMPSAEVWSVFPDLTAHDIYWEVTDVVARIDGEPTGETQVTMMPSPSPEPADGPGLPGTEENTPGTEEAVPDEIVTQVIHRLEMNSVRIDGASRSTVGDGAVEFTGNASSVATMELFLTRLTDHVCFHNVQRTKQEMLKATAGKEGWWRFTVEFTVSCPKKSREEKKESTEEIPDGAASEEESVPEKPEAPDKANEMKETPALPKKEEPAPSAPKTKGSLTERKAATPTNLRARKLREKARAKAKKGNPRPKSAGRELPDPANRDRDRGIGSDDDGNARATRIRNRFLPRGNELNRMPGAVRPLRPTMPNINPNRLGNTPRRDN